MGRLGSRLCLGVMALTALLGSGLANQARAQATADPAALNAEVIELYRQGKYAETTEIAKRALALREKELGPDHPDVGTALNNLALLLQAQARYGEAEPLCKRSLALYEKALGPDDPLVGTALNCLAVLYKNLGRYGEAEPLYKRSLALREKALGPDHPDVGTALNNLALLYDRQGLYGEAEPLYKRSLALREKALGPDHPDIGDSLNNLATLYVAQGRFGEAVPLLKRSVLTLEKALGPEHPSVGTLLNNLAKMYESQGHYGEAEPLYKRSLALHEKALGPNHPDVGIPLGNLAGLYFAQSQWPQAAEHWRRATAILERLSGRNTAAAAPGVIAKGRSEAERNDWYFSGLIKSAHRLAKNGYTSAPLGDDALAREMFETAQWGQGSEAAASLAQMAVRSASGSPKLALLVRDRQDLVADWQRRDEARTAAVSQPPGRRDAQVEAANSARLAVIDARISEIDQRLNVEFPDYAALANPTPLPVVDVQRELGADEALLLFLDTYEWKPTPEETFIWVATKSEVRWVRSGLGTPSLKREVAALRCGLNATGWSEKAGGKCAELLKLSPDQLPKPNDPLPFDAARAHALYKGLFGQVDDLIKGKHLLIVPSGPLTQLPFQVFVTATPSGADNRSIRWLVRDHAITVLPAVSSLKALRRVGKPSVAAKQMIGFGNPLLDGNQNDPENGAYFKEQAALARAQTGCAQTKAHSTTALRGLNRSLSPVPSQGTHVDVERVRHQAPLPETADELCAVARDLKTNVNDIRLGARATETEVKAMSASGALAQYRVLHFATHGALAGQLSSTSEPGLILTPPATGSETDDGYLSASEIAALKLDADWVILSACNTAGGAGKEDNAEALSGLARAFFYAQARALLVSHWEVDSAATVKLITGAVGETARNPKVGRSEALRGAMLALIDTGEPHEAHPSYWAPFVLVGKGGAGR